MTRPQPDALRAGVRQRAPASDALTAARQGAIALLTDRFADDSLTVEDFEQRLDQLYAARTSAELDAVMRELARLRPNDVPAARPTYAPPAEQSVAPSHGDLVAILGSTQRTGHWVAPGYLDVQVVLGEAMIDLRDAVLLSGRCEITIFAALGGVKLLVPPGIVVDDDVSSIMGEVRNDATDDGRFAPGPRVRISGTALMAEVGVRVALPGDPAARAWKRAKRRRWGR